MAAVYRHQMFQDAEEETADQRPVSERRDDHVAGPPKLPDLLRERILVLDGATGYRDIAGRYMPRNNH